MSRKERITAKKQKQFARLTSEQDIRYRGPLSYRAFKILGWLCIILSQVAVLLALEGKLDPTMTEELQLPIQVLQYISSLALPFMLIANFSLILNHSEGYGAQIRRYAILSGLVVVLSVFLFSRYAVGTAAIITGNRADALSLLQELFWTSSETRFLSFNLFIDLLLCALLMYFWNYQPKRVFVGKKLLIFRAFSALPILYEAASIVLKLMASNGAINLPLIFFPFLTVKPPLTFIVFIVLAVFIKKREIRFRKNGKTHEEYLAFLGTKRNSWDFSVYTAVTLAIAGFVDFIALIVFIIAKIAANPAVEPDIASLAAQASGLGLGESFPLLLLAPIMLLFSYTRTHKNKTFDVLIPVIGVAGIAIAYIEGLYQFLLMVPDMLPAIDEDSLGSMLELIELFGIQ